MPQGSRRGGFTLLEVVLAVGLLALLVGMIFKIGATNIALGNAVITKQAEESVEVAFLDLLTNHFSSLPGNARVELISEDTGAQYTSDLTIQNVPLGFTWGGVEKIAKSVQLSAVRRRDGLLDIVLGYYEYEVLEETSEVGDDQGIIDEGPFAEVTLLEDIYIFEWRVLDGRTMEWQYDWDLQGRLPLQMELTYMKSQYDDPIRHIFWIVPKQNPELMVRQLTQGQGGQGGGSVPAVPGGGDNPEVSPPTGGGEVPGGGRPGRGDGQRGGGQRGGGNRGGGR